MKTLYININGEEVQSTDSMVVIGDKGDAIIDSFYLALGEEITTGSHVRGINHKEIVGDFIKDKPEESDVILQQWEEVKEMLLSDDPSGEYTLSLPSEYLHWLRYNTNTAYSEIYKKKYIGQKDVKVIINIKDLYEDSLDAIRRKVMRYLQRGDNVNDIDEFVINDECITRKSKIVCDIRIRFGLPFVNFEKCLQNKEIVRPVGIEDKAETILYASSNQVKNDSSYLYLRISDYSSGYAIAEKVGEEDYTHKYVCIDVWGNECFSQYIFYNHFVNGFAMIAKELKGALAFMDAKGTIITPFKYAAGGSDGLPSWDFLESPCPLNSGGFENHFATIENIEGQWETINEDGHVIVPGKYDWIDRYCDIFVSRKGLGGINSAEAEHTVFDKRGNKLRVWSLNDDDIDIVNWDSKGNYMERFREGKFYGLKNSKGRIILPAEYRNISNFDNGVALIESSITKHDKRKKGFINENGNFLTPMVYDIDMPNWVDFVTDELIKVKKNNAYGLINIEGIEVIPCRYHEFGDQMDLDTKSDLIPFSNWQKWGYMDKKGNVIIEPVFDCACSFNERLAYVVEEEKERCGFIDKTGAYSIVLDYDDITNCGNKIEPYCFYDGRCVLYSHYQKKFYVIDTNGKVVIRNGFYTQLET